MDDPRDAFMEKAVEDIISREMKDTSPLEQIAVTMSILKIFALLRGLPLSTRLRISNILHDYLHTSAGLLKGD